MLNQENVRFNSPRVSTVTRQVTRLFDSLAGYPFGGDPDRVLGRSDAPVEATMRGAFNGAGAKAQWPLMLARGHF